MAVTISYGSDSMDVQLNGATVSTARERARGGLSVPGDAKVVVNGETRSDEYVLRDGDNVEFVKASGAKAA